MNKEMNLPSSHLHSYFLWEPSLTAMSSDNRNYLCFPPYPSPCFFTSLFSTVVVRILAPNDVYVLIPGTCQYVMLHSKWELKLPMELK